MSNAKLTPVEHRFKPGQSGNPGGRPVGTRLKLTGRFVHALCHDFEVHGKRAIEAARLEDPLGYIKVVASLLPKQVEATKPLETMTDEELTAGIDFLKRALVERVDEGSGDEEAAIAPQVVPALQ